ncbi:MAG: ester cyclase [archaeon]|nr:ester cyclase [archaeon]
MSTDGNKAIARRWNEDVWSKRNLPAIDNLLAADFVFNYPPPNVKPNREVYKQVVKVYFVGFPDFKSTIEDMLAEGDKVAVRWTGRGTHKGEFMGVDPTGKMVKITGISILRITGGKIVEEWTEMDNLGAMQQLGVA